MSKTSAAQRRYKAKECLTQKSSGLHLTGRALLRYDLSHNAIQKVSVFVIQPRTAHRTDCVIREQTKCPSLVAPGLRLPGCTPFGQNLFHFFRCSALSRNTDDIQLALKNIQFDEIAFFDKGDRTSVCCFG